MKLKNIILGIFALTALMFEAYFGVFSIVSFIIQIILIVTVVVLFLSLFSKEKKPILPLIRRNVFVLMATIGFFVSIFLVFISYQNFVPGKLSDIIISNGKQTIVFLQMSHIATPGFYATKQTKISELSSSGYILLMEGVRPGTPENDRAFSDSLGFDFTPTLYTSIASFIGLEAQNNENLFSRALTGSVTSVDVSIDDIMAIMGTGSDTVVSGEVTPSVDIEAELANIGNIGVREKVFAGYVARALMNFTLKQSAAVEDIISIESAPRLFEAILDKRNANITDYIVANPNKNIAIVYGGLHFEGVFSALQKIDPNWKIINIISYTPYNE